MEYALQMAAIGLHAAFVFDHSLRRAWFGVALNGAFIVMNILIINYT